MQDFGQPPKAFAFVILSLFDVLVRLYLGGWGRLKNLDLECVICY